MNEGVKMAICRTRLMSIEKYYLSIFKVLSSENFKCQQKFSHKRHRVEKMKKKKTFTT